MTGRVVALFACSALTVSASLPAAAVERDGVIAHVDHEDGLLHLTDGSRYRLPDGLDAASVQPGMPVLLLLAEAG